MEAPLEVIYDGECGFCTKVMRRVRHWDRGGRIHFVSLWENDLEARFPSITREEALRQMIAIEAGGRIYRGADAFPPMFRRLRGGAFLRWPWLVPGGSALARVVYGWVARHRHEMPGGSPACEMPRAE